MRIFSIFVLAACLVLAGVNAEAKSNSIIFNDMILGAGLGAGLGLVIGTIVAVSTPNANWGTDLILGAAWGTLAGTAGGFGVAMIEMNAGKSEPKDTSFNIPRLNLAMEQGPNNKKEFVCNAKLFQVNF